MTERSPLADVGRVAPDSLVQTRIALHWAAQVLSAAGDAHLERAPDDSQSNVSWDSQVQALVGRALPGGSRVALHLTDPHISVRSGTGQQRIELAGRPLSELMADTRRALTKFGETDLALAARDYDMPGSPMADGGPFPAIDPALARELSSWLSAANQLILHLIRTVEPGVEHQLALWPHHFDLGGIFFLDKSADPHEAPQIGFGFSLGDSSYPQPYFYVTPWPIQGTELPPLPGGGHWHTDGFTGAILTSAALLEQTDLESAATDYLHRAVAIGRALIADTTQG